MAPESGQVIAATDAAEEGKFKEDRPYFVHGKDGPYLQNPYYSLTIQGPAMTASAPIRSADGRTLGVLAGQLNLNNMGAILARRTTLRQTDDAFLVNPSSLFVTQPRLVSDPTVLQRGIHTEAVKRCLAGTSGVASGADYRGVSVMSAYRWLPERHLCLVVQVDEAEAFAPSRTFGRAMILIGMLALLVGSGVVIGLARAITRPVRALQLGAARIGRGELDVRLPETSKDELGLLAGEFNRMAAAVSEREAALRESEARHRSLFEHSIDAVLLTSPDGGILAANPAACRMFWRMEEEIRQVGRAGLVDPTDPRLPALLEERARAGKVMGELTFIRKDGTTFPGEISSALFTDKDGLPRTSMIIRDITERKRAEEALARRTRQLEAVRGVSEEITRELDLTALLSLLLRRAVDLAGATDGAIFLWDENEQLLVPHAWHGYGECVREVRLRLGEGLSGIVAERREGIMVNDYRASPYANPNFLKLVDIAAVITEPLLYRNRLLGVIGVANPQSGQAFAPEDQETLRLFTGQAAIAIENARLFEAAGRAAREARSLYEVGQSLTTSLDFLEVLHLIAVKTTELLGTPHAQVVLWDENSQTLRLGAAYGTEAERVKGQQFRLGECVNGIVAETRAPLVVNDYQAFPHRVKELTEIVADIGVPLLYRDRLLGVLNTHATQPGSVFTQDHLTLLTSFAAQAAIAIENARLFGEVRASRERLATLSRRLLEAQEAERRHIARELHDEIGQALTAVKINLQTLRRPGDRGAASSRLGDSIGIVERAKQGVRDLSVELRPSLLDDLGLVAALRWQVDRQARRAGIAADFLADPPELRAPSDIETACFRVAQEALTNVVRHAQAQRVRVEVLLRDTHLELLVQDGGVGFDVGAGRERAVRGSSFGLLGMEERVELVGGEIAIESAPGAGTTVRARFPLPTT